MNILAASVHSQIRRESWHVGRYVEINQATGELREKHYKNGALLLDQQYQPHLVDLRATNWEPVR